MTDPISNLIREFVSKGRLGAALGEAARWGKITILKELLSKGIDPNLKTSHGSPVINVAASGGHVEAIELLLHYGADPNSEDERDREHSLFSCLWALHTREQYIECCKALTRAGARTDKRNAEGMTLEELAKTRDISLSDIQVDD